jgi:hypothetical protein
MTRRPTGVCLLRVGAIATALCLCGCEAPATLEIERSTLKAGELGFFVGSIQSGDDVFRSPYGAGRSADELRVALFAFAFNDSDAAKGLPAPQVIGFSGNEHSYATSSEVLAVETLDAHSFQFSVNLPTDFGGGPYDLSVQVRPGEMGSLGWPSIAVRVEVPSALSSSK